jgi:hypothetical protein
MLVPLFRVWLTRFFSLSQRKRAYPACSTQQVALTCLSWARSLGSESAYGLDSQSPSAAARPTRSARAMARASLRRTCASSTSNHQLGKNTTIVHKSWGGTALQDYRMCVLEMQATVGRSTRPSHSSNSVAPLLDPLLAGEPHPVQARADETIRHHPTYWPSGVRARACQYGGSTCSCPHLIVTPPSSPAACTSPVSSAACAAASSASAFAAEAAAAVSTRFPSRQRSLAGSAWDTSRACTRSAHTQAHTTSASARVHTISHTCHLCLKHCTHGTVSRVQTVTLTAQALELG